MCVCVGGGGVDGGVYVCVGVGGGGCPRACVRM